MLLKELFSEKVNAVDPAINAMKKAADGVYIYCLQDEMHENDVVTIVFDSSYRFSEIFSSEIVNCLLSFHFDCLII